MVPQLGFGGPQQAEGQDGGCVRARQVTRRSRVKWLGGGLCNCFLLPPTLTTSRLYIRVQKLDVSVDRPRED